MHLLSDRKLPMVATAVGALAAALLQASPLANALPPFPLAPLNCSDYIYPSSAFEFTQDNNILTAFNNNGNRFDGGGASYVQTNGAGGDTRGTSTGVRNGRDITIDVQWANGFSSHVVGRIDDDLIARGTITNNQGVTNSWTGLDKFKCVPPAAAAPKPADNPKEEPKQEDPKPEAPLDPDGDADGDGLKNGDEVGASSNYANYGTNPKVADTDGDGFDDGQEVFDGTNPNDKNDHN